MRKNNSSERYMAEDDLKKRSRTASALFGIVLVLIVTVMFAFSVNARSKYTGYVSLGHHHHLTGTSVLFANNWLDDGILNDHFGMIVNPDSIEFSSLKERGFYDSYPPGAILPLYALAKLSGTKEVTFGFVQRWNMFNQYMIALIMTLMIYMIFLRIKARPYIGFIAALPSAAVILFSPSPYYFLHSVYFADQAVLLPFALTIFLETLRGGARDKRLISALEWIVIFAGVLTDYLFVCLVPVIYAKRLVLGEMTARSAKDWFKKSFSFASPAIAAAALFAAQLAVNGPERIMYQFFRRTGLRAEDDAVWVKNFSWNFWKEHIVNGYGENADIIIKASFAIIAAAVIICVIARIWKKRDNEKIKTLLSAAAMVTFPCFLQVYLLREHSSIHDFSALKFSLVLSVAYSLVPAVIAEAVRSAARLKGQILTGVTAAVCAAVCCVNVYIAHTDKAESFFPEPEREAVAVSGFVNQCTGYEDIVFSDKYDIDDGDFEPPKIALSKKRIYYAETAAEIFDAVKNVEGEYIINIFDYGGESAGEEMQMLEALAYDIVVDGDMALYKIRKEDFSVFAETRN